MSEHIWSGEFMTAAARIQDDTSAIESKAAATLTTQAALNAAIITACGIPPAEIASGLGDPQPARDGGVHADGADGTYSCPGCGFWFAVDTGLTWPLPCCGWQPAMSVLSEPESRAATPDEQAALIRAVICEPLGLGEEDLPDYGVPGPFSCTKCLAPHAGTGACWYCTRLEELTFTRALAYLEEMKAPERKPGYLGLAACCWDALVLALSSRVPRSLRAPGAVPAILVLAFVVYILVAILVKVG